MLKAIRLGSVATIHWTAFGLLGLFFLERFFRFTTTRRMRVRPKRTG
jgi:hypothetical protein